MEQHPRSADDPPSGGSLSLEAAVAPVLPWLERSREHGFLGPGPVTAHVAHAAGFAQAAGGQPTGFVDLGSGGGVPGLVLAALWPARDAVLLDSSERRTAFLAEAVHGLGWEHRVRVVRDRAEAAGRSALRASVPVVVSRSFGPPAVTAECAAPLLAVGGRLIVSEPPDEAAPDERWPATGLERLGMVPASVVRTAAGRYQVVRQAALCPERFPRRVGVPGKRPLW